MKTFDSTATLNEFSRPTHPGSLLAIGQSAALIVGFALLWAAIGWNFWLAPFAVAWLVAHAVVSSGYLILEPNMVAVTSFLGNYRGTVTDTGLRWMNPFFSTTMLSRRVQNFATATQKVNDLNGNPIEIASVVVWRLKDTARAVYAVSNYSEFLGLQTDAALRTLAMSYAYDGHENENQAATSSLRDNPDVINEDLRRQVQERVEVAGIEVLEARLSHLAYAPEIAQCMLQRQQAHAMIAARAAIVEGAVGMVKQALTKLSEDAVVTLDEERKAQMVCNLLVVLCSERGVAPVLNAGSIHQ